MRRQDLRPKGLGDVLRGYDRGKRINKKECKWILNLKWFILISLMIYNYDSINWLNNNSLKIT